MRRLTRAMAAISIVLAGAVVFTPGAGASVDAEAEFVSRVNALRSERGLPQLTSDGALADVARRWSDRMADVGDISHNAGLGDLLDGWKSLGENVGVGPDVGSLHDAFVASPAHLANLVDADFTHIGIGIVQRGGSMWVTEVFMQPMAGVAAPAAATTGVPAPDAGPTAAAAPATATAPSPRAASTDPSAAAGPSAATTPTPAPATADTGIASPPASVVAAGPVAAAAVSEDVELAVSPPSAATDPTSGAATAASALLFLATAAAAGALGMRSLAKGSFVPQE